MFEKKITTSDKEGPNFAVLPRNNLRHNFKGLSPLAKIVVCGARGFRNFGFGSDTVYNSCVCGRIWGESGVGRVVARVG